MKTPEQEARDMLQRMDIDDAQSFTSGDLVELANLIARDRQARKPVGIASNGEIVFAQPDETRAIEPALTPEEWASVDKSDQAVTARTLEPLSRGGFFRRIQVWTPEAVQVMALANAALPDDDPRKITREDVELLRGFPMSEEPPYWQEAMQHVELLAAKLAALLPPEG